MGRLPINIISFFLHAGRKEEHQALLREVPAGGSDARVEGEQGADRPAPQGHGGVPAVEGETSSRSSWPRRRRDSPSETVRAYSHQAKAKTIIEQTTNIKENFHSRFSRNMC